MLHRLFRLLLCTFAALAAFGVVRAAALIGRPFPGFLVYANGMVSMFGSDDWSGTSTDIDAWDLVREVDGQKVAGAADILEAVRARPAGTVFRYTVQRGDRTLVVPVRSSLFTFADFASEPLPWLLTGTLAGTSGLLLYLARPAWTTFGFATFGVALGIALLRLDLLVTGAGALLLQAILPLVPAALVHLALVFPERPRPVRRWPLLLTIPYATSVALGGVRAAVLFEAPVLWVRLDQVSFAYCGIASLFLLVMFMRSARSSEDPIARERARVVLWGLVPAIVFVAGGGLLRLSGGSRSLVSYLALLAVWVWIGSLAYAAAKRNVFEFEIVVRRAVTYTILWAATIVLYAAALGICYATFRAVGYSNEALVPFLGVVVALPFIPGLFGSLRSAVENRLFPLRVPLFEMVRELSDDLSRLRETTEVCERVAAVFRNRVRATRAIVYAFQEGEFRSPDRGAPRIDQSPGELIARMAAAQSVSAFDGPTGEQSLRTWMRGHGFTLVLPLVARSRIEGCLAVGEPPDGRVFSSEDVDTLAALASRIAISLANAHAYERVRDLDQRLRAENRVLREELELHSGFPEIVGRSPRMQAVFRMIGQVAAGDTTVLLLGETGTGKEVTARAIHARSARRDGPLVKVNCAAIPAGLVESELFGHERGAFTDAAARRHGKFELAHRGTIFLDEVAELPLEVQAKLLRVLQEREFERVGGSETMALDVRVVASTNRDLARYVRSGRFREDLFFRLNVFPIRLPPLRERREDISLLVEHFLRRLNERLGRRVAHVSESSLAELERYSWPGNVRELENVLERAIVLSDGDTLSLPRLEMSDTAAEPQSTPRVRPLADVVRAAKIAAIDRALSLGGSQVRAAELLGLKPPSLSRMIRDLGLRR